MVPGMQGVQGLASSPLVLYRTRQGMHCPARVFPAGMEKEAV